MNIEPKPTTIVTFLLDRTQSMLRIKSATIEGFNAYLDNLQQESDATIDFTLLQFDHHENRTQIDKVCVAVPVKDVPFLTEDSYQPRGSTPLIEAATKTIIAVAASVHKYGSGTKVVICIQTDGEENCSNREYTWNSLKALIQEKQALGWEFNFMGAGIDAYAQGARMGLSSAQTMSYGTDAASTREAFLASSANIANYASGRGITTNYSLAQKVKSGDVFDPKLNEGKVQSPDPILQYNQSLDQTLFGLGGFDLSQPLAPQPSPPAETDDDLKL